MSSNKFKFEVNKYYWEFSLAKSEVTSRGQSYRFDTWISVHEWEEISKMESYRLDWNLAPHLPLSLRQTKKKCQPLNIDSIQQKVGEEKLTLHSNNKM
jgi:hypothetical protein